MKFGSDGFEADGHIVKFLVWGKPQKGVIGRSCKQRDGFHQRRLRKNSMITRDGTQGV